MIMKNFFTLVFSLTFAGISFSQEFDTEKLNQYFNLLSEHQKLMGSILITKNGKVIYEKSVGFSDVQNQLKNNEKTKFRIGSITKTFTAVLILKTIEEGKLSLDERLEKFFPKIKNSEKITIKQMLQHRSGIFSYTDDKNYALLYGKARTQSEIIAQIESYESLFQPDEKHKYSNSNYFLLGVILEKIHQKTYAELLQKYITKPLNLQNTFVGGKISAETNEAYSYHFQQNAWQKTPEENMSVPMGAGAIVSTPADLIAFSEALFNGKILTKNSLTQMLSTKDYYGLGLMQIPFYEKIGYGHGGNIDSFDAMLSHFPTENISFARVYNGLNIAANEVDIAVLSTIFGRDFELPTFIKTIKVSAEDLAIYLGTYTSVQIPLKMNITQEGEQLFAQATGQNKFPLEAFEEHKFRFDRAGIVIEFLPNENKLILKQRGTAFEFHKE